MSDQVTLAAAVAAFQRGDLERARQLAERQLAEPEPPAVAHHLVGLIDCRWGRFDSGVDHLRRASAADPENVSFRLMLVRALIDCGRAREALDIATAPHGPSSANLHNWQVRAEAAFHADERGIEAEALQVICSTRPDDPLAWTSLSRSLLAQSRFDEAENAYRRALQIAPTNLSMLRELGLMLERANQLGGLRELLGGTLAAGVPKAQLADLWALRELRKGRGHKAWSLIRDVDPAADPVRLNELKAKAADAADYPAEAFAAATAMNKAMPDYEAWRNVGRDFRKHVRGVHDAMATWPRLLPAAQATDRPSPAFLVGFPRSGTTLADTFLMGHPQVRVLEEVQMLAPAARTLPPGTDLPVATPEQLDAAREVYFAEMDRHLERDFDRVVIDKLPLNLLSLAVIASLFPDARVIFVQRHPLDSVLSAYMQHFKLNAPMASFLDLAEAAELYESVMQLFMRARERTSLAVHTLVYEELVADPEIALRSVVDFLGLEWRPELLDHRATAARRGAIATPSYSQVGQGLSKHPSGRWRRYRKQLEPVLPVLLPWAERLGYAD
jgi:tetratricopeptide (TPR) repeat protein